MYTATVTIPAICNSLRDHSGQTDRDGIAVYQLHLRNLSEIYHVTMIDKQFSMLASFWKYVVKEDNSNNRYNKMADRINKLCCIYRILAVSSSCQYHSG